VEHPHVTSRMRWHIDHRDCCRGPLSGTCTRRTFGSPLCNPFDDFVCLLTYASGQLKPLQGTSEGFQDMNVHGHCVSSSLRSLKTGPLLESGCRSVFC